MHDDAKPLLATPYKFPASSSQQNSPTKNKELETKKEKARKMKRNSLQHLLVTIFFCFFLAIANAGSLVQPICKKLAQDYPRNVSYQFCVSELETQPQSSKATAPQLARISFGLGISRANTISSTIDKLLKVPTLEPLDRNVLKDCSDLYYRVPNDLEAGLKALKDGDYDAANEKVSAVTSLATTCGGRLRKNRNMSALLKQNSDFYKLAAISLGFTKLLRIVN